MRSIVFCAVALLLAGCADSPMHGKQAAAGGSSFSLFGSGGDAAARPRTIVVSDFILADEVPVIDRGFSTRQESKGGNFPILERRARTAARVNDEINATIVVALKGAGLDALAGSVDSLRLGDKAVVLKGRLRANEKKMPVERTGFGSGRGNVVADMTLTAAGSFGSAQGFSFSAALPNNVKLPKGKEAAAQNTAIAAALAAADAAPEKLSPDVELQARRLGLAIAEKVIAYAREQGWMNKPDDGGVESGPKPAPEADNAAEPSAVKLPAPKPAKKPAA